MPARCSGASCWRSCSSPLYRRLLRATKQKPNLAALLTLLSIVVMVIMPVALITASLVQQAAGIYDNGQSGHIDFGRYFRQIIGALPQWVVSLLERFDLTSMASLQQSSPAPPPRSARSRPSRRSTSPATPSTSWSA
jgi:predicted PurR-regulated permease PerM